MHVRGAFNLLLRPGLRKDFRDSYMGFEEEWSRIVRSGTMDRAEIEATTISGLPRQVTRGEGESFTFFDAKLADKITYTDEQFGNGFSVTKEMMEDDTYGKSNQSSKWLGRSVKLVQEYRVADFLDDAFTGAIFTGFNGEVLITDTHELLNSPDTWSNLLAGNPALGVTGLQAAFELGEQHVDHQGDPIPVRIDTLILNVAEEWMAIQLLQNPDEPFTTDRNINTTRRKRQLNYIISHYKDQSGSDWFARDSKIHDAHLAFKVRPQFIDWFEDRVQAAFYAARQRFCVYFYDPRGWIGSNAT